MKVTRTVDLSVAVDDATQVFPGDPRPRMWPAARIGQDGYNVLHVELGTHTGTHVDAPYHVRAGGLRIDALPVDRFVGPAVVLDVRELPARAPIGADRLADLDATLVPIVLVHTGWSRFYGRPEYFDHPYLTPEAAEHLLERGVRTIALDTPNPDPTDLASAGRIQLPVHQLVADAAGVLIENLTAVEQIDFPEPWLAALPVRLTGADAAPCRAIALQLGP